MPEAQARDLAGPVQYLRAVSKPPRSECSSLLRQGTAMNRGKVHELASLYGGTLIFARAKARMAHKVS